MTKETIIAVDAMGGEGAPKKIIDGIILHLKKNNDVFYKIFGNKNEILNILPKDLMNNSLEIIHTDEKVLDNDSALEGAKKSKKTSMWMAVESVKNKDSDIVISAGNTGALMAMAKFVLKTLPGIDRPAIATYFPTQRSESVMLDLGANVECNANNLVQFAVMGEVFARNVLGLENPSVGILNVGAEDLKGNNAVKEAFSILQNTLLPIKFYGFVEGDDIGAGTVDVIVTDGFTGNIILKLIEGITEYNFNLISKRQQF